jgi:hypothetical protein
MLEEWAVIGSQKISWDIFQGGGGGGEEEEERQL